MLKPIEEFQVVRHSSEQCLAEMNVSLNKTGDQRHVFGTDDFAAIVFRIEFTYLFDTGNHITGNLNGGIF
jgi:hypothetical protein